jgi:hypothetical protein
MKSLFFLLVLSLFSFSAIAQKYANANEYLSAITKEYHNISKSNWSYISAVAHGKSAKKVANKRKDLIETTKKALHNVKMMPGFEGNKALRDSTVSYLTLSLAVITEDYEKIMDMEEIAEQSFDAMEAYLLAQNKASQKMEEAGDMVDEQVKIFAKEHNITLVEDKSNLSKNMVKAGEVTEYYNQVFLIFFKSFKQEAYMLDALQKGDVNAVEQNKNALNKFAKEGQTAIDKLSPFRGDASIINSCKELLKFYITETETKIATLTDFLIKKENFDKKNAAFQAKKESERSKADVDQINAAGKEFNEAVNNYNKVNNELFNQRKQLVDNWNKSVQTFLDKHIPQGK